MAIPLKFYLNDDGVDKTGFKRLRENAFAKAIKHCSSFSNVTLGPHVAENNTTDIFNHDFNSSAKTAIRRDSSLGHQLLATSTPIVSNNAKSSLRLANVTRITDDEDLPKSQLKDEERTLYRKKILAELEHLCRQEAQEKVEQLKKEWARRDAVQLARLQAELQAEMLSWEQGRGEELQGICAELQKRASETDSCSSQSEELKEIAAEKARLEAKEREIKFMERLQQRRQAYDKIYKNEVDYRQKVAQITDVIISNKDLLQFQTAIKAERELMKAANQDFLDLIEKCKVGNVTTEDVEMSFSLLGYINNIHDKVMNSLDDVKRRLKEEEEKAEEEERRRKEAKEEQEREVKQRAEDAAELEEKKIISKMGNYVALSSKLREVEASLQEFLKDDSLKKFRSDCQRAVNVAVNSIAPTSAAHVLDKIKKLSSVLAGHSVTIGDRAFRASTHPLGVVYCHYLLAEKIVKQGQDVVSSYPDSAFAIASVTLELWAEYPLFGHLLLATFYRVCPYLIPVYWPREDMTDEQYYRKLGFLYTNGEREDLNMFLKREGGVMRLYCSLMVTQMRSDQSQHPFQVNNGWTWLAMFTSLEPCADISATLLLDMLEVTAFLLLKFYRQQFRKLLHLICAHYLPLVEKVTPGGRRGPFSRLKNFLEGLVRNNLPAPPKGLLPANFW